MKSGKPPLNEHAELVHRFIAGDRQASAELYDVHSPPVLAYLVARVNDKADAEDLLHDSWIKLQNGSAHFDGKDFHAWFFQIARHTLYDFSKSRHQRMRPSGISDDLEWQGEHNNAAALSREEELSALRDCIKAIGGEFAEAIQRNKVDGETPEDIANELGVEVGTIYSRIFRGKKKLQACLEAKLK